MRQFKILYLCPVVYRPLEGTFAKKFGHISTRCAGDIFTLSSSRHRARAIGNFRFHAETLGAPRLPRNLVRFYAQTVLPLLRLWGRCRPDAIVVYDPYASSLAGMILKLWFRTKLIVEVNGDYHRLDPLGNRVKKWLRNKILCMSMRYCDAVKVLNREQEQFLNRLGIAKPVYRFPEFAATEYFQSLEPYPGDYLLSVGYPFELKGVDILIQAFKRVANEHKKIKLRVMGYCPDKELIRYKQLAEYDPRVEFVRAGWMEDVGEQMRGCYALVNAARSEAMGKVHLEAMACRKPIIATRTNGGRECVEDGRTGLLCDIEDVEDLAKKLTYLLSNPELAEQMGEAGLGRVRGGFSEENYIKSFVSMIEEVTDSTRSS